MLPRKSIERKFRPIHGFFCRRGCQTAVSPVSQSILEVRFALNGNKTEILNNDILKVTPDIINLESIPKLVGEVEVILSANGWENLDAFAEFNQRFSALYETYRYVFEPVRMILRERNLLVARTKANSSTICW